MIRLLLLLSLAALLLGNPVEAAQPNWLTGLLGTPARQHRTVHHRPPSTAKKTPAAAVPATAAPPKDVTTNATPAIPLPRPRPTPPTAADATSAASTTAPATDAAAPVTPLPAAPAPAAPTPAAPLPAAPPTPAAATPEATSQPAPVTADASEPPRIYQTACPAVITGLVEAKPLPPISSGMCQEQSPLSVTSILVNGRMLPLSAPATINCEMATDLPGWVAEVDNYIFALQKTRIKAVNIGGSFECRDRNVEGGSSDLSEHGRADAVDFVGFTLEDGRTLTVGPDYNSADAPTNRLMHFAHDAACTRFTTVLGPDANALHHDHFHLDLGCHGKTCTYRLCE